MSLDLSAIIPGTVCALGPINVSAATSNPGGSPFTGTPLTGTLTAAGFTIPALSASDTCSADVVTAIGQVLGLPTTDSTLTLTLVSIPGPPTTTTTAPTTTTAAPKVVVVQPHFTG